MIRLAEDHNWTTARFKRSRMDAWPGDHASCIELPQRSNRLPLAVGVPLLVTVLVLSLLYVVSARAEERRQIRAACELIQVSERANVAACRHLFYGGR